MERRLFIWLHPSFYDFVSLNNTPIKSFLISSYSTQLIYIIVIEQKYFQ